MKPPALLAALVLVVSALGIGWAVRSAGPLARPPAEAGTEEPDPPTDESRRTPSLRVEGAIAARGPFALTVRATGRVEALQRAALSPPVSERVERVLVSEGERVEAGQVLVTLDPRPFEITRNEARARVSNAESDYRINLLSESDRTPERLEMWANRSGLTEAREQLARTELDLEGTRITAPFAGWVTSVEAEVGERAVANVPLVTLVDIHVVRVRAEVLESDFGHLVAGGTGRVSFPAWPDETFEGTVTALGPEIDPERGTGVVYLEIANEGGRIRPGMYAEVELAGLVHDDRVSVPREAVLERDRRRLVFRASDGRAEWQYVETGLETTERIEITSGVAPGDTVLVGGHLTLAHGAPVTVEVR